MKSATTRASQCTVLRGVFWCVTLLSVQSWADEARFRDEAPSAWKSYVEDVQYGLVAETEVAIELDTGETSRYTTTSELSRPCARHVVREDGATKVKIANDRYSAAIQSQDETDWSIEKVNRPYAQWDMETMVARLSPQARASMVEMRGLTLWLMWLPDIVDDPGFSIASATDSAEGFSVEFEYAYQGNDVNHEALQGGTLVFDPEHHWLLKSASVNLDWSSRNEKGTLKVSNTFEPLSSGLVYVAENKIDFDTLVDGRKQTSVWTWTQSADAKRLKSADERFFLSHYGISEPIAYQKPRRFTSFFWLGLGSFTLLVAAVLVRQHSVKKS